MAKVINRLNKIHINVHFHSIVVLVTALPPLLWFHGMKIGYFRDTCILEWYVSKIMRDISENWKYLVLSEL